MTTASPASTLANRWLVLGVVSIALFLIVIDMTVLYTALPRLTHDLHASVSEKLWIVNAYSLVMAGLLPATGALCDRLGHKAIFVWGLLVFGLASIVAAFSPSPEILIASRILLAIGAAMMMPATLSIIRHVFDDPDERAFAIGVWAAVASGGAALGPLVGGALLEFFWWGSVFLINVPLVLLAIPAALAYIPKSAGDPTHPRHIVSSILILVGIISVAYAIKEMGMRAPTWPVIFSAFALGVASLWAFVVYQKRAHMPLIEFSIFKDARFSSGVAGAIVAAASMIGAQLVITQRLQLVIDMTPLQAGLAVMPLAIAAALAGPAAGLVLSRFGAARMIWLSLLISGAGAWLYAYNLDGSLYAQIVALAVFGFGIGAAITASSASIMFNVPAERAGMAASIEEVSYELGGGIGVAMAGSLMSFIYSASLVVPEILKDIPAKAYESIDDAHLIAETLPPELALTLTQNAATAFDNATHGVLFASGLLFVMVGLGIAYATRKRTPKLAV